MRKYLTALLCVVLLAGTFSCALAQSVACPEAHLVLTVPDSWSVIPLSGTDDPELCLLLEGDKVTLSVYVADAGGLMPEAFQVFVGDETESGTVVMSGVEMSCIQGKNEEGEYWIYTWLDRRNQVQMYFLATGSRKAARTVIGEIMDSLGFD